jgi:hypothetical protein
MFSYESISLSARLWFVIISECLYLAPLCFCCTTLRDVILAERCSASVISTTCILQHAVVCWVTATTGQGGGSTGQPISLHWLDLQLKLLASGSTAKSSGSTGRCVFVFNTRGSHGSTGPVPLHYRLTKTRLLQAIRLRAVVARYYER